MNIFVLDDNPIRAAASACDRHCVKMILETAQMLSSCIIDKLPTATGFYKKTHINHPCNVWARESRQNFKWLIEYGVALSNEYTSRYGKYHKSTSVIYKSTSYTRLFPNTLLTPFAQAMPDIYRGIDAIHAYRRYYAGEKHKFCTWKNPSVTPVWWESYRKLIVTDSI